MTLRNWIAMGRPGSKRRWRWIEKNHPDRGLLTDSDLRVAPVLVLDAPETFFAIRLTDGEMIYGEYSWMEASGPGDWTFADEGDHDEPTEYEIVEMTVRSVAKRTFGVPSEEDDDE